MINCKVRKYLFLFLALVSFSLQADVFRLPDFENIVQCLQKTFAARCHQEWEEYFSASFFKQNNEEKSAQDWCDWWLLVKANYLAQVRQEVQGQASADLLYGDAVEFMQNIAQPICMSLIQTNADEQQKEEFKHLVEKHSKTSGYIGAQMSF